MDILVLPLNRTVTLQPGTNLLSALQAAEIPISYSCMAGRCGTCRCKIREREESKWVLACQTYITEPCIIETPDPGDVIVHPARTIKATVSDLVELTHDVRLLRLKPQKPIEFSPGQYAHLLFGNEPARSYSMAGLCTDPEIEFHIRLIPGGRVSAFITDVLKVGDTVKVRGPLGTSYLRRNHAGPMLCVAGSTGLAPILSIVRGAVANGMSNDIHLYFSVRSHRDLYGLAWLQSLQSQIPNLKLHVVIGMVTDSLEQDPNDLSGWRAYICGSPPMVEAVTALVTRKGVAPDHVYADAFYFQ